MSITERVQQTIDIKISEFSKDPEFIKLSKFYQEMQQSGIAQQQTYSLPPADTIGRRLYQLLSQRTQP